LWGCGSVPELVKARVVSSLVLMNLVCFSSYQLKVLGPLLTKQRETSGKNTQCSKDHTEDKSE